MATYLYIIYLMVPISLLIVVCQFMGNDLYIEQYVVNESEVDCSSELQSFIDTFWGVEATEVIDLEGDIECEGDNMGSETDIDADIDELERNLKGADMYGLLSPSAIIERTSNCIDYFRNMDVLAELEPDQSGVSIAYSHVTLDDIGTLELSLALHYSVDNYHCINIDKKASSEVVLAVKQLAGCYNQYFKPDQRGNVDVLHRLQPIYEGDFSELDAEYRCLRQAISEHDKNDRYSWNYWINIPQGHIPLTSTSELVALLERLEGKSITGNSKPLDVRSFQYSQGVRMWRTGMGRFDMELVLDERRREKPPSGVKVLSGSSNTILSYEDARYIVSDSTALDYLHWCTQTLRCIDLYWDTMIYTSGLQSDWLMHRENSNCLNSPYRKIDKLPYLISKMVNKEGTGVCLDDRDWNSGIYRKKLNNRGSDTLKTVDLKVRSSVQTLLQSDCHFATGFITEVDAEDMVCLYKKIVARNVG